MDVQTIMTVIFILRVVFNGSCVELQLIFIMTSLCKLVKQCKYVHVIPLCLDLTEFRLYEEV